MPNINNDDNSNTRRTRGQGRRIGKPLELGSIAKGFIKELGEIGEQGMLDRLKESSDAMVARAKDRREHPENHWHTGENGTVKVRTAPDTCMPDIGFQILPDTLNVDSCWTDQTWIADWDAYNFYIIFDWESENSEHYDDLRRNISVQMLPEQYLDTVVSVKLEFGDKEIEHTEVLQVNTIAIGTIPKPEHTYTYSVNAFPMSLLRGVQLQFEDQQLFDTFNSRKGYFTALKHRQ